MNLRCKLFGCGNKASNYKYLSTNKRACKNCGKEYIFLQFYPDHDFLWLDKEFVNTWGSYEDMISARRYCEVCDRPEYNDELCCPCGCC